MRHGSLGCSMSLLVAHLSGCSAVGVAVLWVFTYTVDTHTHMEVHEPLGLLRY